MVPKTPQPTMSEITAVYEESYPSRRLLELIGDKWTPIVLYVLGEGTKRYGEMQRHLPDVSKKMLTQWIAMPICSTDPPPVVPQPPAPVDDGIGLVHGVGVPSGLCQAG